MSGRIRHLVANGYRSITAEHKWSIHKPRHEDETPLDKRNSLFALPRHVLVPLLIVIVVVLLLLPVLLVCTKGKGNI